MSNHHIKFYDESKDETWELEIYSWEQELSTGYREGFEIESTTNTKTGEILNESKFYEQFPKAQLTIEKLLEEQYVDYYADCYDRLHDEYRDQQIEQAENDWQTHRDKIAEK